MTLTDISLASLPLRPSTLQLLQKRGFSFVSELEDSVKSGSLSNLAEEVGVDLPQAASLYREVQACCPSPDSASSSCLTQQSQTASALLQQEQSKSSVDGTNNRHIITFCRGVDQILDGGLSLGELTELAGLPGCGKTQWAMQLAVDARLPEAHGGVAGGCLYIDTEGSFSPERCFSMAQALVDHVRASRRRRHDTAPLPAWFTPNGILQGIHVLRVHDEAAQTAVLGALEGILQEHLRKGSRIKLVVIDSMAFHHRAASMDADFVNRTRQLTAQAAALSLVARDFDVAVLAINQMTTKLTGSNSMGESSSSRVVPALGESWAHAVTTRILLRGTGTRRTCQLVKSPRLPQAQAEFCVYEDGIRDPNSNKRPKIMHG